jgi:hypothetical protein
MAQYFLMKMMRQHNCLVLKAHRFHRGLPITVLHAHEGIKRLRKYHPGG